MRLASFDVDYWRLDSGEDRNREHPDTFWIPSKQDRENLKPGELVRLLFQIECDFGEGIKIGTERMWVCVQKAIDDGYLGILTNSPASYEETDDIYLVYGAEVYFLPEHIIDIDNDVDRDKNLSLEIMKHPRRRWMA